MIRFFFCLIFFLGAVQAHYNEKFIAPEVRLSLGTVRGSLMKTRLNRTIYSFRSIRYAEPPVGDLRFRPAVPVKPWRNTFDASQEIPSCPQPDRNDSSEDCLRINVYTTKLPSKNSNVKRPVIVFIHPSSFEIGSARASQEGPNYLLDHDIVLALPNYRIGALGFLSTGDALAPGNLGLKDQVVALRWVQKHIHKFGGDPNLVTIAGCSAGARSVTAHLLSPMSKGLFHHAIAMSGAVTGKNPLPHDQRNLAIKQAKLLGCPSDTSENIINCLKTKSAEEMGNSSAQFREWNEDPVVAWSLVVEPDIPGVERFLTAQPADLIREGKFHNVPIIIGITQTEHGLRVIQPVSEARNGNYSLFDDYNANWTKIAPISFGYERGTRRSIAISEELRRFYLHNKPLGLHNWEGLAKLYADGIEGFDVHRCAKLLGSSSRKPVYYYEVTYQGRYSYGVWPDGKLFKPGHMEDMQYEFYMPEDFPIFEDDAPELPTMERMTAIWANFAKYGEPIPNDNELFTDITWPAFTPKNKEYLNIGHKFVVETGLFEDRMNEWEKLFPLSHCQGARGKN